MRILLVREAARLRPWMRDFASDLRAHGFEVRLGPRPGGEPSRLVGLIFELDRLTNAMRRHDVADAVAPDEIAAPPGGDFTPEVVVDLTGRPAAYAGVPTFALAFDGIPGEDALLAALTENGAVTVAIHDPGTGEILEEIRPSLECAQGPIDATAVVGARVAAVLLARLLALRSGRRRPGRVAAGSRIRIAPAEPSLGYFARRLRDVLARHLYRMVSRSPHWRIGWRHVDGPGLVDTGNFEAPLFRPFPDGGLRCYADPFPIEWQGETHVLLEDFDHRSGKGMISAIRFDDGGPIGPAVPVLEEPWHLSFPFPIVDEGNLYVVPESTARRDVALYRCIAFPDRWERVATLLDGVCASDVAIVRWADRWWMFSTLEDGRGGWSDMLAIHSAPSLVGPWRPHRDVPVMIDVAAARSAGRPFVRDGRLHRPVQDCSAIYGGGIDVVEVTRLDDEGYEQEVRLRLRPNPAWPGRRLHTVNRVGRLELIDGAVPRPKWDVIDRLVAPLWTPRRST